MLKISNFNHIKDRKSELKWKTHGTKRLYDFHKCSNKKVKKHFAPTSEATHNNNPPPSSVFAKNTDENYLSKLLHSLLALRFEGRNNYQSMLERRFSFFSRKSIESSSSFVLFFVSLSSFYGGESERAIILRKIQTPIFSGYDP